MMIEASLALHVANIIPIKSYFVGISATNGTIIDRDIIFVFDEIVLYPKNKYVRYKLQRNMNGSIRIWSDQRKRTVSLLFPAQTTKSSTTYKEKSETSANRTFVTDVLLLKNTNVPNNRAITIARICE